LQKEKKIKDENCVALFIILLVADMQIDVERLSVEML
jgi:hypothetical protein